jgi:UDP-3-O-acyl N-acetylglucosamine deacetylase
MPMRFKRLQKTLASVVHVSGRGYWSGAPVTVTFEPAPENSGIRFKRVDLPRQPSLAAVAKHRTEATLRTRLQADECSVEMIEHVMSALYAMEIDNCVVLCNACEMPGLDGSAMAYALAIEHAGTVTQSDTCPLMCIDAPFRIGDDRQWIMALPTSEPGLQCEYRLDYGNDSVIASSTFRASLSPKTFIDEIAAARTFVTESEAAQLQARGLAKHVSHRDLLVFGEEGPIDNVLRFDDECARHKLLDLVGDLALCGMPLQGKIVAYRSGHNMNGEMAQWLSAQSNRSQTHRMVPYRKVA